MHDHHDHQRMNADDLLAAALRALPVAEPPRDGWERIALRAQNRWRVRAALRAALPAAFAAGIALAIGLPRWHSAPSSAPRLARQTDSPPTRAAGVETLRAQSQRLQSWVRKLERGGAPLSGGALASAVALQDRIGLIDLQLTAATDPATRASLWQQRIALLQQLGMLHLQDHAVAQHTRGERDGAMIL